MVGLLFFGHPLYIFLESTRCKLFYCHNFVCGLNLSQKRINIPERLSKYIFFSIPLHFDCNLFCKVISQRLHLNGLMGMFFVCLIYCCNQFDCFRQKSFTMYVLPSKFGDFEVALYAARKPPWANSSFSIAKCADTGGDQTISLMLNLVGCIGGRYSLSKFHHCCNTKTFRNFIKRSSKGTF